MAYLPDRFTRPIDENRREVIDEAYQWDYEGNRWDSEKLPLDFNGFNGFDRSKFFGSNAGHINVPPKTMQPFKQGDFPDADETLGTWDRFYAAWQNVSFRMPGWSFNAEPCCRNSGGYGCSTCHGGPKVAIVRIMFQTKDVYHPALDAKVQAFTEIRLPVTRRDMLAQVRMGIHKIMTHEADEWLQIGGYMPYNPHAIEGQ
jgi:hypothetical protein